MAKFAMTTQGPVPAEDLGIVLPQEHLLFDLSAFQTAPLDEREHQVGTAPMSLETSADLRRSPMTSRENLVLWDEEVSVRELGYFRDAGGRTVVDCTLPEMKRDVRAAARIAAASDVNVIVATGHYLAGMQAPEVVAQPVNEMTAWMLRELREGVDDTGIRAGVIKVGISTVPRMPPTERKCLEAAARAQAETGVPITIHNPVPFEKRGVPRSVSGLSIAQLTGGLSDAEPGNQCHELVRHLAQLYPNSQVKYLHAPAIVDSEAIHAAMVSDRSVNTALEAAARSEFALVGIGSMGEDATIIRVGHLDQADRARLLQSGAVGTLNGRFFDALGRPVGHLERRTIAISWDQMAAIPTVVAVAAGAAKRRAIAGALETGCLDVLVTDEATARSLLEAR